jgi:hypothetical protein
MGIDDIDIATNTGSPSKLRVRSQQDNTKQLGKRDIARIVNGEVASQLPTPREEIPMRSPSGRYLPKIAKGQVGSSEIERTRRTLAAPNRNNFQVDEIGRAEFLAHEAHSCNVPIMSIVASAGAMTLASTTITGGPDRRESS